MCAWPCLHCTASCTLDGLGQRSGRHGCRQWAAGNDSSQLEAAASGPAACCCAVDVNTACACMEVASACIKSWPVQRLGTATAATFPLACIHSSCAWLHCRSSLCVTGSDIGQTALSTLSAWLDPNVVRAASVHQAGKWAGRQGPLLPLTARRQQGGGSREAQMQAHRCRPAALQSHPPCSRACSPHLVTLLHALRRVPAEANAIACNCPPSPPPPAALNSCFVTAPGCSRSLRMTSAWRCRRRGSASMPLCRAMEAQSPSPWVGG